MLRTTFSAAGIATIKCTHRILALSVLGASAPASWPSAMRHASWQARIVFLLLGSLVAWPVGCGKGTKLSTTSADGTRRMADTLAALYARERVHFGIDTKAAAKLMGEATPPADVAAFTVVANVLLNLDETLTKE